MFKTADLCDDHADNLTIAAPMFNDFGGEISFSGPISTVKCFEDNSFVHSQLEQPGKGRVLVVDGGGSLRCALVGDVIAQMAADNGWAGIVVYGCIRDSGVIADIELGVKAIDTLPLKSVKKNIGEIDVSVHFADADFIPGHYLYAYEDGIILSAEKLV